MATYWTILTRVLRVYPYNLPTSLFRFVGKDLQELCPTRIQYAFSGATAG